MNIVLIGLRGSGKTTIGKSLARHINFGFIDTDTEIESKQGMKISEIVQKFGWKKFRFLESDLIRKIINIDKKVISPGGGVVENEINMINLKQNSCIFYLDVEIEILKRRISTDLNRPPLTQAKSLGEEIRILYNKRHKLYLNFADYHLKAEDKTPKEIISEISVYFRKTYPYE